MVTLYIDQQGTIEGIYSDSLANLLTQGKAEVRRASHVEPGVDDKGDTCWYADMSPSDGPTLGPFYLRQEALDSEVAWLHEHKFKRGQNESKM